MPSNLGWSLEDIIRANRIKASSEHKKFKYNPITARKRGIETSFKQLIPKGSIEGKWEHDLFQDNSRSKNIRVVVPRPQEFDNEEEEKRTLRMGNLPFDLNDDDFKEMLDKFDCKEVCPHYDENDQFLGVADLIYISNTHAVSAMHNLQSCAIDGNVLSVRLISCHDVDRHPPSRPVRQFRTVKQPTVDRQSVKYRLSYREFPRQYRHYRESKRLRQNSKNLLYEYHFLDRLADDEDFLMQKEEDERLHALDMDLDNYMQRANKLQLDDVNEPQLDDAKDVVN